MCLALELIICYLSTYYFPHLLWRSRFRTLFHRSVACAKFSFAFFVKVKTQVNSEKGIMAEKEIPERLHGDPEACKNSLIGDKGALTRINKRIIAIYGFFKANQGTSTLLRNLETELNVYMKKCHEIETKSNYMFDISENQGHLKFATDNATEVSDLVASILQSSSSVISRYEKECSIRAQVPAAQEGGDQAARGTPQCKPVTALKPDPLSRSHTVSEFQKWKRGFTSYYKSSNIHVCDLHVQRSHLESCLDAHMISLLDAVAGDEIPVIRANDDAGKSCIRLLEEKFKDFYPTIARRNQWWTHTCPTQKPLSDFYSELKAMGANADLDKMLPADMYVQKLIAHCHDEELRRRLLRLDDASLDRVLQEIHKWEASNNASTQIGALSSKGDTRALATGAQRNDDRCNYCGSTKHSSQKCDKRDTLTCWSCGKKGHSSVVCRASEAVKAAYKLSLIHI